MLSTLGLARQSRADLGLGLRVAFLTEVRGPLLGAGLLALGAALERSADLGALLGALDLAFVWPRNAGAGSPGRGPWLGRPFSGAVAVAALRPVLWVLGLAPPLRFNEVLVAAVLARLAGGCELLPAVCAS